MATAYSTQRFLSAVSASRPLGSPLRSSDVSFRPRPFVPSHSSCHSRRASHRQRVMPRASAADSSARGIEDGRSAKGVEDAFPAMAVPSQLTSPLLAANGGSSPPPAAAESTPPTSAAVWTAAALPFLFPALGGVLFGYDIGATSSALLSLKDPVLSGTDWFDLSSTAVGLVERCWAACSPSASPTLSGGGGSWCWRRGSSLQERCSQPPPPPCLRCWLVASSTAPPSALPCMRRPCT
ncbi:unnamed protein product [Closterium sp. NIES-65]|nr:unnamed protein product [Closterium sp. NIES-65]